MVIHYSGHDIFPVILQFMDLIHYEDVDMISINSAKTTSNVLHEFMFPIQVEIFGDVHKNDK